MALYIESMSKVPGIGVQLDVWTIGKPIRKVRELVNIMEVKARGAELEYIRKYLTAVPDIPKAKEIRWRGNWAEFIVSNIGWERGK